MLEVNFLDKTHSIKTEWEELTLDEFVRLNSFVQQKMPEKYREMLFHIPEEGEDEKEFEFTKEEELEIIDFWISYIQRCSTMSKKELRRIPMSNKGDDLGLEGIFKACMLFLFEGTARKEQVDSSFEHKGVEYFLCDEFYTQEGNTKRLQNETFEMYEFTSSVNILIQEQKTNNTERLAELTAAIYRPKGQEFDKEDVKKRAELFKDLTMNKVLDAYFFLNQHQVILLKYTNTYSAVEALKKLHSAKF
jgi:hypothetical protein